MRRTITDGSKKRTIDLTVDDTVDDDEYDDDDDFVEKFHVQTATSSSVQRLSGKARLAELISGQPAVDVLDLHPRNKALIKSGSPCPFGAVYNAHRVQLLTKRQLTHLMSKVKYTVQPDGCWIADGCLKQRDLVVQTTYKGRPRGLQLDVSFRRDYFTDATSFEQTQIILANLETFALSSEHEISHLCHTAVCLNPDHLCWELHRANHERERCRYTRSLRCPNCPTTFSLCDHNPRCIPCSCSSS